jgi:2-iminobutanoate/2-iminopropanoate deaminase
MRNTVLTKDAPAPLNNLYSQAIIAQGGSLLFTAGQVGIDPKTGKLVGGGLQAQTRQVMENIKAIVEHAGTEMTNVVKVTVLLDSIDDFAAMNEIYTAYFPEAPPARTAYEVARLPIGALVEIEAVVQID